MGKYQRPVVSILTVREIDGEVSVLLQRRSKPDDDTPYLGYLELPQGKISKNESMEEAASRELREETGLELRAILLGGPSPYGSDEPTSSLTTFRPPICVVDTEQNHIGVAIIVTAGGRITSTQEAAEHEWVALHRIPGILASGCVFPLTVQCWKNY
ncbi:NUDIX hydrolase [Catellatospora coxensis]